MKPVTPAGAEPTGATRLGLALALVTVIVVFFAQYSWVRSTNFGGVDEWLYIDLSSRGVLSIPYANRPLVLLWTTIAATAWPHDLASYWLFHGLYLCLAACLTTLLTRRLVPESPLLAILAGVFAAVWAPLDALRLDSVVGTGYAGFTLATMAAITLFVESWHRASLALLALGATVGFVATRGVESVIPVLMVAPILVATDARGEWRRFVRWTLAWGAVVGLELVLALLPLLSGAPSYQSGALGLDPHPGRILARLAELLGMQAGPLVTSSPAELLTPAAPLAVGAFVVLVLAAVRWGDARSPTGAASRRPALRALALGLLLAASAHAGLALAAEVKTPSRTQILSAPGFGLALAGAVLLLSSFLASRAGRMGAIALGAWVVGVGAGRVVAVQDEWDRFRGVHAAQHRTLSDLVGVAPALEPGTLVVLLDETGAFGVSLTFRHAVAYLYPAQAIGLVPAAADFLYPWSFTPAGIAIVPWPDIRQAWDVEPTLHPWDSLVVVRRSASGQLEIVPRWPDGVLPPLPDGARYAPLERIVRDERPPPSRRILGERGKSED